MFNMPLQILQCDALGSSSMMTSIQIFHEVLSMFSGAEDGRVPTAKKIKLI